MNDEQIKHMVNRFLAWSLPETFNPDAGISFERQFNLGTPYEGQHKPTGTNLLDYTQAEQMVRHMVAEMSEDTSNDLAIAREAAAQINEKNKFPMAAARIRKGKADRTFQVQSALRAIELVRSGRTPAPDPRIAVAREIWARMAEADDRPVLAETIRRKALDEDSPLLQLVACLLPGMTIKDLPPVKGDVL